MLSDFAKLLLIVTWSLCVGLNTIYGGLRGLTELSCLYDREGAASSVTTQFYVTQVFNNAKKQTKLDFDYFWLQGASNGTVYKYNGTGGMYSFTDTKGEEVPMPYHLSFYDNKTYFDLDIEVFDSGLNVPMYYKMSLNQTNLRKPIIEEYGTYSDSTTAMKVTYTIKPRVCTVGNSFHLAFGGVLLFMLMIMLLSYLIYLSPFGFKFMVFFHRMLKKIPLTKWHLLPIFCNEITNEPTYFQENEPRVVLSFNEIEVTDEQDFIEMEQGISNYSYNNNYISVSDEFVYHLDYSTGEQKFYKVDDIERFRKYLGVLSKNPKMLCLTESQDHHFKMKQILTSLCSNKPENSGFFQMGACCKGSQNMSVAKLYCTPVNKPEVTSYGIKTDGDNVLMATLKNFGAKGQEFLNLLIKHNRAFFKATGGHDGALITIMSNRFSYSRRPNAITTKKWDFYTSDVSRIYMLYGKKPLFVGKKMRASDELTELMNKNEEETIIKGADTCIELEIRIEPDNSSKKAKLSSLRDKIECWSSVMGDLSCTNVSQKFGTLLKPRLTNISNQATIIDPHPFENLDLFLKPNYTDINECERPFDEVWVYFNHAEKVFRETTKKVLENINLVFRKDLDFGSFENLKTNFRDSRCEYAPNPIKERLLNYKKPWDKNQRKNIEFELKRAQVEDIEQLPDMVELPSPAKISLTELEKTFKNAAKTLVDANIEMWRDQLIGDFSSPFRVKKAVNLSTLFQLQSDKKKPKKKYRGRGNKNKYEKSLFDPSKRMSKNYLSIVSLKGVIEKYSDWLYSMGSKKAHFGVEGANNSIFKKLSRNIKLKSTRDKELRKPSFKKRNDAESEIFTKEMQKYKDMMNDLYLKHLDALFKDLESKLF